MSSPRAVLGSKPPINQVAVLIILRGISCLLFCEAFLSEAFTYQWYAPQTSVKEMPHKFIKTATRLLASKWHTKVSKQKMTKILVRVTLVLLPNFREFCTYVCLRQLRKVCMLDCSWRFSMNHNQNSWKMTHTLIGVYLLGYLKQITGFLSMSSDEHHQSKSKRLRLMISIRRWRQEALS